MPVAVTYTTAPPVSTVLVPDLVDIISGSFGAGHDAAAHEIARRLEARGYTTRTWDVVDLLPGPIGHGLRGAYLRQMQSAPSSWGWLLKGIERREVLAKMTCRLVESSGDALLQIAAAQPTAIVSTHPFASQALGHLRETGRLDVPVVTYLTDMSVHRLWVHEAVDVHLALHGIPANDAYSHGAKVVRVVRPVVPDRFSDVRRDPLTRASCRHALGLPRGVPLALVTGGSHGVGALEEAAADITASGKAIAVVLCGHNMGLYRRLAAGGHAIPLGWVEDMPALLSAVDVVVQNAGGFTSLESLAAGLPVISYRCLPGHGETNAAALDAAGAIAWVRDETQLPAALVAALSDTFSFHPSAFYGLDVVDAMLPVAALAA